MENIWIWIVGLLTVGILAYRAIHPRKKVTFEAALLAVKSAILIPDMDWTVPSYVKDKYPSNSRRVDNDRISIIYGSQNTTGELFELIDINIRGIGQGGLNVYFLNGEPTSWGRFGDMARWPGVDIGDTAKAKAILAEVKKSLIRNSPN